MSQTAYPDSSDLDAFFTSQGLTMPSGASEHLAEAVARWERLTGYQPFLGSSDSASWYFDGVFPGSNILDLQGGFWVITSVATGISYDDDTGDAKTLNQDYNLLPLNAANMSRGWDAIRFLTGAPVGVRCVKVVGKRGYAEELPDDVWSAILKGAASQAMLEAIEGFSALSALQQGPVKHEYDNDDGRSKIDRWAAAFNSAVVRYARI